MEKKPQKVDRTPIKVIAIATGYYGGVRRDPGGEPFTVYGEQALSSRWMRRVDGKQTAEKSDDAGGDAPNFAKLTGAKLDDYLASSDINEPDGWSRMKVEEKRVWLTAQFEDPKPDDSKPTPGFPDEKVDNTGKAEADPDADPKPGDDWVDPNQPVAADD